MKLQINRREEQEGLIFKKTVYYLDVNLEFTEEELELIKKHEWEGNVMAEGIMASGYELEYNLGYMIRNKSYPFKQIEHLAYFENLLIENAKTLKANLEAVESFTISGPVDIEL